MDKPINYGAGNTIHFIQAKLALGERKSWRHARIDNIENGTVTITCRDGVPPTTETVESGIILHAGEPQKYACADTDRLREIYESGRVFVDSEGNRVAILARYAVLIIPYGDGITEFSAKAEVIPNVTFMEDGAVKFSPTANGGWQLFSVRHIQESES